MCLGHVSLTFLIAKTSLNQFGTKLSANFFLYFDVLTISPILNLGSSSLISWLELIYVVWFYINMLHINCPMIYIIIFINYMI